MDILCENLVDEYKSLKTEGRYIEASRLLVSVYPYEIKDTAFYREKNVIIASDFEYNPIIGYVRKEKNIEDQFL